MTVSTALSRGLDFRAIANADFFRRSLAGIAAGYRAHRLFTDLSAKSDAELRRMGLSRHDLPRIAFKAM